MRVVGLWRYPVKSMTGEPVDTVTFDRRRGVLGDRLWAVHDLERGVTASARRLPALLRCRARYGDEPGPDAGPGAVPAVIITLPDGAEISSADPQIDGRLSAALERDVRLVALPSGRNSRPLPWRERLAYLSPRTLLDDFGITGADPLPRLDALKWRDLLVLTHYATPPGSYVDVSPVHVITESSLAAVGDAVAGAPADVRRFRPNVLLGGAPDGLPEHDWTGTRLALGAAQLVVDMPTVRCVVPSREQADVARERRMTRAVADVAGRYLGAYAQVVTPGAVRIGDAVELIPPGARGPAGRLAHDARRSALTGLARVLDTARRSTSR